MPVVEGTGGFISQKDIRPIDQGPGNGDPLLLTLTAMPGVSIEAMKQTKLVQKSVNPQQIDFLTGQPLGQGDILFDIQGLEEMRGLKDQSDMLPAELISPGLWDILQGAIMDPDRAGIRLPQSGQ